MGDREKYLLYYAHRLGYIDKEQFSGNATTLWQLLLKDAYLSQEQVGYLRLLYLEHALLACAVQAQWVSQQQTKQLLERKIRDLQQHPTFTLHCLAQGVLSYEQITQLAQSLYKNKSFSTAEMRVLSTVLSKEKQTPCHWRQGDGVSQQQAQVLAQEEEWQLDTPSPLAAGGKFRHYHIIRELGRGGMGVVYQAKDLHLDRVVALKAILPRHNLTQSEIQRFIQETKALAKLEHPHIIRLFEAGIDKLPYYTMECVAGETLLDTLKRKTLSPYQAAKIMQQVASALHLVHRHKIIHRDIKPPNIMIGPDQQPKIMDFGVAKMLDNEVSLSFSGQMVGTPAYMSPEQAKGQEVDRRADVYSMGATLYEALTGRPPFQGESYANIMNQVFSEEVVPLRRLNPDIPRELEIICLKCLEKDPKRRYASAAKLAQDLENFLAHRPLLAKSDSLLRRVSKWTQRYPAIAAMLVMVFVCFVLLMLFYFRERQAKRTISSQAQRLQSSNRQLQIAKEQKEQALRVSQENLAQAQLKLGEAHFKTAQYQINMKNFNAAAQEILQARKIFSAFKQQQNAQSYLRKIALISQYTIQPNLLFPSQNLSWDRSKHSRHLAFSRDFFALQTSEKIIGGRFPQQPQQSPSATFSLEILPDSDSPFCISHGLLIFQRGNKIVCYDLGQQQVHAMVHWPRPADRKGSFRVSPEWKQLLVRERDIWHLVDFKQPDKVIASHKQTWAVRHPRVDLFQDEAIAFNIKFGLQIIENLGAKNQTAAILRHFGARITTIKFSPDGRLVVFGDQSGKLVVYRIGQQSKLQLVAHAGQVKRIAFSPDSRFFVSIAEDKKMALWNAQTYELVSVQVMKNLPIHVVFDASGRNILLTSRSLEKLFWQKWRFDSSLAQKLPLPESVTTLMKGAIHSTWDFDMIFHSPFLVSSEKNFLGVCYFRRNYMWQLAAKQTQFLWLQLSDEVMNSLFTPDEKFFCVQTTDEEIILHHSKTGNLYSKVTVPEDQEITAMAVSQDSRYLLCGQIGEGSRLGLYKIASKKEVASYRVSKPIRLIGLNSQWLVLGYDYGELEIFSIEIFPQLSAKTRWERSPSFAFQEHELARIHSLAWHPQQSFFVSGDAQGTCVFWKEHEQKWQVVKKLSLRNKVVHISFSPEGDKVALFTKDELYIYDLQEDFLCQSFIGYSKGGIANFDPSWEHLILPSAVGEPLLYQVEDEDILQKFAHQINDAQ